ncbi:hypothetical protein [Saccharothrix deserti]|uniref:hypothetical protein n=1 Tax=Saccharothrix deserti TaxID=2593674 RepID=UPI00131E8CFF|nr:hypothetical protein [Saccharothrix deserti]
MVGQSEVVRCRDVMGVLREITVDDVNEFVSPGSVLQQRLVRVNQRVYVRKYVSRAAGRQNPRLYELLENEVRAGTRLGQVFHDAYPRELARLVAYNVDVEEPFVLLHEYIGEPAAGAVTRFDDARRRRFEHELLRALWLTALAGVVHGAVTMDVVRWDDGRLQLVDFEFAERIGEPRRRGGGSLARSPEQLAGTGLVDTRDDLWAAGLLIRELHLGVRSTGARPDRDHDPERLRALLDPVFGNPVERRPYAADLLDMLRGDSRVPAFTNPDAVIAAGRDMFELVSRGKRGPVAPPVGDWQDQSADTHKPQADTSNPPEAWKPAGSWSLPEAWDRRVVTVVAAFVIALLITGMVVLS